MAMAAALLGPSSSWSASPVVLRHPPSSSLPASPHILALGHSPSSSRSPLPGCPSSPFTESNSLERYQRDSWLHKGAAAPRPSPPSPPAEGDGRVADAGEDDIALQLPELKGLLELLRVKRGSGAGGSRVGRVSLVGTGSGDPELLTLKAVRAIEGADLILYDRLVSHDVLRLVRTDARLLYVGKTAGYHSRTQVGVGSSSFPSVASRCCHVSSDEFYHSS
uniref:Uroporphyrinogen-III C-methyltransferase n=1 Tax=Anthurium amnicola TaxID=1678845 RepID=A0A1D1YYI0_9ARAE